jgi:hypothetical protein
VPVDGGSRKVALYAIEGPENWFEDAGSTQLSNGATGNSIQKDAASGTAVRFTVCTPGRAGKAVSGHNPTRDLVFSTRSKLPPAKTTSLVPRGLAFEAVSGASRAGRSSGPTAIEASKLRPLNE